VLTGRPPYPAGTPVALLESQASGPPAMPGVDPGLRAVAAACLRADPADRPLHAGVVAAALRSWMTGDPEPALAMAPAASFEDTAVAPIAAAGSSTDVSMRATTSIPAAERAEAAAPAPRAGGAQSKVRPGPRRLLVGMAAIAALLVLALVGAGQLRLPASGGAALPSVTAAVTASPRPVWVAGLIDDYTAACGDTDVPSAADLLAMGPEDATQFVQDRTDACQPSKGKGKGHGQGGD
jgi:hypothetical protein